MFLTKLEVGGDVRLTRYPPCSTQGLLGNEDFYNAVLKGLDASLVKIEGRIICRLLS